MMNFIDLTIILIVGGLIGIAVRKIRKDKKRGVPCTGCSSCPVAGDCSSHKTE